MSRMWVVGTHVALDSEEEIRLGQETACSSIVDRTEEQLGQYSSNENEQGRRAALGDFLQKCAYFKAILCRQKATYRSYCSESGQEFSSNSMTFAGGEGSSDARVRLCLWPGLLKYSGNGSRQILEPELVWTM